MAFILPEANTFSEVAKNQHLVPRTYMRMWSNNTDSVWVLDKKQLTKGFYSQNVNNINYKTGFHDIKAGDIFVPDEALDVLFGFMRGWTVECDSHSYTSLRDFELNYYNFDKWIIINEHGEKATTKHHTT